MSLKLRGKNSRDLVATVNSTDMTRGLQAPILPLLLQTTGALHLRKNRRRKKADSEKEKEKRIASN